MTSAIKVGIYSRAGRKVDEIIYDFQTVSWLLDGTGQLPITLPYSNPKATQDNIRLGNLVAVQFSNGLPDWGGVMDTPLRQTSTDVNITVYEAKRILSFQETTKTLKAVGPPGAIFRQIIQNINSVSDTKILLGAISSEGDSTAKEYHYTNALQAVSELARTFRHDWAILPFLDGQGRLSFTANWWAKRGVNRTGVATLEEGKNAEFTLEAQGQIASSVRVVGAGSTWGDARLIGTAQNENTKIRYGFREKTIINTSTPNTNAALTAAATGIASTLNEPISRLQAMTINRAPGLFADYDLGDTVSVRAFLKASPEWVLSGDAYRLRSRELLPNNTCRLILEKA